MPSVWDVAEKSVWDSAAESLQNGAARDPVAEARDKELYRTQFPEMAAQDAATNPTSRVVQEVRAQNGPPPTSADVPTRHGLVSTPTQGYYDDSKRPVNPPTDWAEVGRQQVRNIPKYAAAAGTAAGLVLAPELTIPAIAGAGLVGAGSYQAGRAIRSPLEQTLQMKPSDQGTFNETVNSINEGMSNALMSNPIAINNATDMLTTDLPNAAKGAARWAANKFRFPDRLAGRYLKEPSKSAVTQTALKERIPLTGGKATETAQQLADEAYAPVDPLLQEADASGATVDTAPFIARAQEAVDYYERVKPGSLEHRKAIRELNSLKNGDTHLLPSVAEERKQYYNQAINDWSTSMNRDLAKKPAIAVQKEYKRGMPEAIAESTSDPEAYLAANEEYGPLGKLLKKRGRHSPVEKADIRSDDNSTYRRVIDFLEEKLGRPVLYARELQSSPKVTDLANVGAKPDIQEWMKLFRYKYGPPLNEQGPPPPVPDSWQGPPRPTNQNDWTIEDILNQQMAQNTPTAEAVPGTLMEGEVPRSGSFTMPEGYGQVKPGIEGYSAELNRPPQVMPDTENVPGTLMEGEVPVRGFKAALRKKKK